MYKIFGILDTTLKTRPADGTHWSVRVHPEREGHREPLNQLEKQVPSDLEVHFILDNYSTHKSAEVRRWRKSKKRRRFHFHFMPTSSSWLNQVERWFALITERMIRRGTFRSVHELEKAIYQWLATWNDRPKPFVCTAMADVILEKVCRCKELNGTAH